MGGINNMFGITEKYDAIQKDVSHRISPYVPDQTVTPAYDFRKGVFGRFLP